MNTTFGRSAVPLVFLALFLSSCAAPRAILDYRHVLKTAPIVRAGLVVNESQASVGVAGPFKATAAKTGAVLWSSSGLPPAPAQAGSDGLWLGGRWLAASDVKILPERDGSVQVNGRYCR